MSQFLPETINIWLPDTIQLLYLVATAFFIRGLKLLNSPQTARRGNQLAAIGMLIGVIITLFDQQILSFELIIIIIPSTEHKIKIGYSILKILNVLR